MHSLIFKYHLSHHPLSTISSTTIVNIISTIFKLQTDRKADRQDRKTDYLSFGDHRLIILLIFWPNLPHYINAWYHDACLITCISYKQSSIYYRQAEGELISGKSKCNTEKRSSWSISHITQLSSSNKRGHFILQVLNNRIYMKKKHSVSYLSSKEHRKRHFEKKSRGKAAWDRHWDKEAKTLT